MSLQTLVKLSKVNNLHDARYAAGMGVTLLGVSLDPSDSNFMPSPKFQEIRNWIVGANWIGELETTPKVALSDYEGLSALQTTNPEALLDLQSYDLPLWLKITSTNPEVWKKVIPKYANQVAYFLLEPETALTTFEDSQKEALQRLAVKYPLLLGFGFSPKDVTDWAGSALQGIALQSQESEEKVGYKDFDSLADILEQLEVDE